MIAHAVPTLAPPRRRNAGCATPLILAGVFLLAAAAITAHAGPFTPTSRPVNDGARATVDLPASLHMRNAGGRDGAGLCVFTSCEIASRWQQVLQLAGFQQWMRSKPGGGWPEKLDQMIRQFCSSKGLPVPAYVQHTGGDDSVLDLAIKTGRCPCVTYAGSDDFYRSGIDHMVCLAHIDETRAAIIDNNRPGTWLWMSRKDFLTRWRARGGGWAVVFLTPPPPPYSTLPVEAHTHDEDEAQTDFGTGTGVAGQCPGGRCPAPFSGLEGQCPGGRCLIPSGQNAAQPEYLWKTYDADPTKQFLFQGGTLIGAWAEGKWHPSRDGKQYGEPTAGVQPPIAPPAGAGDTLPDWATHGVVTDKVHRDKLYWISGSQCTRGAAHGAIEGDSLADDSKLFNLSVVGPADFQERFKADWAKVDTKYTSRVRVTYFSDGDWQVSQFRLPRGLQLRKPAVNRIGADVGAVGLDLYDLQRLLDLLALMDGPPKPAPAPAPPVDPSKPDQPDPSPTPQPTSPSLLLLAFLAALIAAWRNRTPQPTVSTPQAA